MRKPGLGDDTAAIRALDEAELQQVGLVDVLDRVGLFAERDRECRETNRPAVEALDDRPE